MTEPRPFFALILPLCSEYIIEVEESGSASGLASLPLVRYILSGGAFMLTVSFSSNALDASFADYLALLRTASMYRNLGSQWALTLLACLSDPVSFVPLLFHDGAQSTLGICLEVCPASWIKWITMVCIATMYSSTHSLHDPRALVLPIPFHAPKCFASCSSAF